MLGDALQLQWKGLILQKDGWSFIAVVKFAEKYVVFSSSNPKLGVLFIQCCPSKDDLWNWLSIISHCRSKQIFIFYFFVEQMKMNSRLYVSRNLKNTRYLLVSLLSWCSFLPLNAVLKLLAGDQTQVMSKMRASSTREEPGRPEKAE